MRVVISEELHQRWLFGGQPDYYLGIVKFLVEKLFMQ